ncbi:nucleotidyltransferase [Candidatus Berkelbacteria bacterium]|nr:nucleotidyltransferase [Candidatus Berkelbacteria bacterium]
MKPTLLVMAAGIGSRYGGIKQLDQFGPSGETLVDYALYDAIEAGFGKIVFVVSAAIEADCRRVFEPKLNDRVPVEFVVQALTSHIPRSFTVPAARTKPWGTAQAVLVAKEVIAEPFVVINADDFYGRSALQTIADFLRSGVDPSTYAMVGYQLRNTLSEHGTVSRGICEVDQLGNLVSIVEHTKVRKVDDRAESVGESTTPVPLTGEETVSMNCWGFHPAIFPVIEERLAAFLATHGQEDRAEFYIPLVIDHLIQSKTATIKVLPTAEAWFGVTYREDVPVARETIASMIEAGKYPSALWGTQSQIVDRKSHSESKI